MTVEPGGTEKKRDRHSPNKVQMLVRFPTELKEDLVIISGALGITPTEAVNMAVTDWVEQHSHDENVLDLVSRFAIRHGLDDGK